MKFTKYLKLPIVQVLLISTAIFILFFPHFYTSTDEREYIENAYLISQNRLVKTDAACYFDNVYCGYFNGDSYISKYNLGLSLIFVPFVVVQWQLVFVVTFIVYLLGILVFSKLLRHHKLPQKFLYLYAFFPILIYYSKKPLTETFSNTLTLGIYYLLFCKSYANNKLKWLWYLLAGALCGILVLIRYTNALIVIVFLLWFLVRALKSAKLNLKLIKSTSLVLLKIFIGAIPFLISFLLINKTLYGGFFTSGYSLSKEEWLVLPDLIPKQLILYVVFLNLLYPGMLVISFLSRIAYKWMILLLTAIYIVFYMGFPGYNFSSGVLDLIFGLRFFVPILGLILLLYFDGLNHLLILIKNIKIQKLLFVLAAIVLVITTIAISYTYSNHVDDLKQQSDKIYQIVSDNEVYVGGIENRILINEAFKNGKIWLRVVNNN